MCDKPFCLMPFLHFHVGERGSTKACCVGNIPFGNINDQSFEEIWSGDTIKELRAKFLKGEPDNRCRVCLDLEEGGAKSLRQETFEKFPDYKIESSPRPKYFDIRFSNVCNFRCRTCWHGASSKWFEDSKSLGTNIGSKAIIENIKDYDRFISELGPDLLNADEIYFAGGEPLVTEEHYKLISWLVENNATSINLRYNTNLSHLKFKEYNVLDLWSKFDSVEVMASVDASHQLGEYIRKEFSWTTFVDNIRTLKVLNNVRLKVSPTVSVYNVTDLPAFYRTLVDEGIISELDFYINILHRPDYFNIQILPQKTKVLVLERYKEIIHDSWPEPIKKSFLEILTYMTAKDRSVLWSKFIEKSTELDDLRGEIARKI